MACSLLMSFCVHIQAVTLPVLAVPCPQMNPNKFVAVDVIANFPKVKNLTTDRDLLVKAMRQSPSLQLDEESKMVRPRLKTERTTLILRDIDGTADEVKGIFDFEGCGKINSIRADVGSTWFVQFESQDDCLKTALALVGKTFKGKPVRAGVKSETLVKGFYAGPPTGISAAALSADPPVSTLTPAGSAPYPVAAGSGAAGGWQYVTPPGATSAAAAASSGAVPAPKGQARRSAPGDAAAANTASGAPAAAAAGGDDGRKKSM